MVSLSPNFLIYCKNDFVELKFHLYYKAQLCLCICCNSSKTTEVINMKFCTIDHLPLVSVISYS